MAQAGLIQHRTNNCEHGASRKESLKHVFKPQETLDRPCDVTLVADAGKAEFKAHRQVLSKASPFFQKLLNSDMRESKEGIVRLEMFSESVIAATLEFIYTGNVKILTLEIAEGLIVIAHYLFLTKLMSLAMGVAVNLQTLNTTNCFSSYHFAEIYKCEELLSQARQFILENFTTVAKTEEFWNLSNKEVEMWISSDEINVSAEDEVLKIILAWIDRDKSERKKYFAELFRQVRLAYVTHDYLRGDVVTNDLVKRNEGCLDLVKDAMNLIDSKNYHGLFIRPRKSLETAVIVVSVKEHILGFFPREDKLCRMGGNPSHNVLSNPREHLSPLVSCHGKLYCTCPPLQELLCYDPFSKTWAALPCTEERNLRYLFATNKDEMYAFVSKPLDRMENDLIDIPLYITKYKPDSNSWEDVSSLKFEMVSLSFQEGMCIVAKDSFIYFIGGRDKRRMLHTYGTPPVLKDVYRYDLDKQQGTRIANLQIERESACGAAGHEKIFVAGGMNRNEMWSNTCEVYDETTNEWHFIAGLYMPSDELPKILSVDDKLYVLASWHDCDSPGTKIQCYDLDKDEWNEAAEIPIHVNATEAQKCRRPVRVNACAMRVFKGLLSNTKVQKKASVPPYVPDKVETQVVHRRKCIIL